MPATTYPYGSQGSPGLIPVPGSGSAGTSGWFQGPGTQTSATSAQGFSMSDPITALIGGAFSAYGASKQNKANQQMAKNQMKFQERMSSTAYQRAAKDLEAAGLNRVLALGSPASSPGGATARMENVVQPAINTALAIKRQGVEISNIEATTAKTQAETQNLGHTQAKIIADTDLSRISYSVQQKNMEQATAQISKLGIETQHAQMIYDMFQNYPGLLEAQYSKPILDWGKSIGAGVATGAAIVMFRKLPIPAKAKSYIAKKLAKLKGFGK